MNSHEDILLESLQRKISSFFIFSDDDYINIKNSITASHTRAIKCFSKVNNKYYDKFNHLHSGQYAAFLYFLAHEIFVQKGTNETSEKIYYLNKIMHSIDLYYEVKLPSVFYWEHPLGSVLGRAVYADRFTIYQNCTIGGSIDSSGVVHYPEMGEDVTLFSYACVLGKCKIGKNTIIASHAYVINQDIPENSIVFGQGKDLVIKPNSKKSILFKT